MKAQFVHTLQDYRSDYEALKQLGTSMLGCNAMLVLDIAPEVTLLLKTYPRPITTNNEGAQVAHAGGSESHVSGPPKISFEGPITFTETENGVIADLAELIIANNGCTNAILYDGRPERWLKAYELIDCSITFDPSEIDSENRSQNLTISGNMKYMYFGQNATAGQVSASVFGGSQISTNGTDGASKFLQRAQQTLNVIKAGNSLIQATKNIF